MEITRNRHLELIDLPGSASVVLRPHFRCVDDQLFFLISRRPYIRLSANETSVWAFLKKECSVDALRARFPAVADQIIQRFVALGICEIVQTNFSTDRRRVLVFEPHSDDAALSVGGTMWLRRHECEFVLVTIGSRSNFTSYHYLDRDYFKVAEISSLRNAESALYARLVGGRHRVLGQPEALLRYRDCDWSLEWYRRHRRSTQAFVQHHSSEMERRTWAQAIREALEDEQPDEIWFPLGSPHTDHQLTRDACLLLVRDSPKAFAGREIRFYQDVPYAARFPEFTTNVLDGLGAAGAVLVPERVSISSVFAEKLHLVSLYASQGKMKAIEPDVEKCAQMAHGSGGLAERFWLAQKFPTDLQPDAVRCDGPVVRQAADQLAPWLFRNRNAKHIRLLMLAAPGRWAEDMEYLLGEFPNSQFDAYVATMAEVEQFASPRVRVSVVGSGLQSWGLLALRLIRSMASVPTLFLAGERRLREARSLSLIWPMNDSVVLPTMDHLVSALKWPSSRGKS